MIYNIDGVDFTELNEGSVTSPKGFRATGIYCGIRKVKKDLGIIISDVPAAAAAVYTTNQFQAAPLLITKQSLLASKTQRAIIANSGNANAFTGEKGLEDAKSMRDRVAENLNLLPTEVTVASTGVIGERLPIDVIIEGIDLITQDIEVDGGLNFSEAIITTDTTIKSLAVELIIDDKKVTIGGTSKGSGMIHPNMATMLAFVTSDVNISSDALQRLLKEVTETTFNMITVDGDTSTNDMLLVMANGLANNNKLDEKHPEWEKFYKAFNYISEELAKMIAKDGEGATKLITVTVDCAKSKEMAQTIAKKIVGSNLVKTAVFGSDANWGRLIMAIGNSGYQVDENCLDIRIGEVDVLKNGKVTSFDENNLTEQLNVKEVKLYVNLNLGEESATAWGCDLTYDYVRINASYRS
ncbi:MAG: bifunctional ornithine acetyltransferase/N-acetylglutamate synthase [Vulcanibacillus sp.]